MQYFFYLTGRSSNVWNVLRQPPKMMTKYSPSYTSWRGLPHHDSIGVILNSLFIKKKKKKKQKTIRWRNPHETVGGGILYHFREFALYFSPPPVGIPSPWFQCKVKKQNTALPVQISLRSQLSCVVKRIHRSWTVFVIDDVIVYFLLLFTFHYHFLSVSCYYLPYLTSYLPTFRYLTSYLTSYLTFLNLTLYLTLHFALPYLTSYLTLPQVCIR